MLQKDYDEMNLIQGWGWVSDAFLAVLSEIVWVVPET
jgi:hypothetical protein